MPSLRLLRLDTARAGKDHDAVARAIERAAVDVVCLHGAPSLLRWRSVSAALARKAGLVVVGGGRTSGGNLLLSTLAVDVDGVRELAFGPGVRPPGAVVARLRLPGGAFVVVGARFTAAEPARSRQAAELRSVVGSLVPADLPTVLCVDDAPGGPAPESFTTAADRVFADARLRVTDVTDVVGGTRIELELPSPAATDPGPAAAPRS